MAIGMRTGYLSAGWDGLPSNIKKKKSKRCGVCSKKFSKSSGITRAFQVECVYVCNECAPEIVRRMNQAIWLDTCTINNS